MMIMMMRCMLAGNIRSDGSSIVEEREIASGDGERK